MNKEERFLNMEKNFLMYKSPFSEKHLKFYYNKAGDDEIVNNFIENNFPKLFSYLINESEGKKLCPRLFYHGIAYANKKLIVDRKSYTIYNNVLGLEITEHHVNNNNIKILFENDFMFIRDTAFYDFEIFTPNIEIIDLSMINNENFKRKALLLNSI